MIKSLFQNVMEKAKRSVKDKSPSTAATSPISLHSTKKKRNCHFNGHHLLQRYRTYHDSMYVDGIYIDVKDVPRAVSLFE